MLDVFIPFVFCILTAYGCSSGELSKFPTKYAKDIQKRVLNMIHFARPDNKDWLIKQRNFKRSLLMVRKS